MKFDQYWGWEWRKWPNLSNAWKTIDLWQLVFNQILATSHIQYGSSECQWPSQACVLSNQFNRLWCSHTYYWPAAIRLAGPCNIQVIFRFRFKNLLSFKYHPRDKHLFYISANSCYAWSSFANCSACFARFAHPTIHSSVYNMSAPAEKVLAAFFGFLSLTHDSSRNPERAFSLHRAFPGAIVKPYVLSMPFLHIRLLSFTLFCAWLLPCPFPSDVPNQYRRAIIAYVQGADRAVLNVSINIWFFASLPSTSGIWR